MSDLFLHREMVKDLQATADSLLCVIGTWRFFYSQCNPHLVEALELVNGQLEEEKSRVRAIEDKFNGV